MLSAGNATQVFNFFIVDSNFSDTTFIYSNETNYIKLPTLDSILTSDANYTLTITPSNGSIIALKNPNAPNLQVNNLLGGSIQLTDTASYRISMPRIEKICRFSRFLAC